MYEGIKIDKKFIIKTIILFICLLAILILSIILLNNKKFVILYEQENQLKNAAIQLFEKNTKDLPQNIGDSVEITLKTFITYGYLENIYDGNKKCDENSFVKVTKINTDEYQYEPNLICGDYNTKNTWGNWSNWEETTITNESDKVQVEKKVLYNYREVSENLNDWSEWEDIDKKNEDNKYEYEYQTLYQYQDTKWKWYNENQKNYADGYYITTPSNDLTKDETQTSWTNWKTLTSGSIVATNTKQVQYREKTKKVQTSKYYNFDYISSKYPNRLSWDGTKSDWIYKYYSEDKNGFTYNYDKNKTAELSVRTRTLSAGEWQILTSGSVTSSENKEIRFRNKKYRFSRYKYCCYASNNLNECWDYIYKSSYDTTPPIEWCNSIEDPVMWGKISYVSGSMQKKYGDYDRHENNGTNLISTVYGRKSWIIDGTGQYYDYENYTGTLAFDDARREVQYRELNNYSAYSNWITKTSGTYSVTNIQDIAYKEKLYKYYYLDWNYWSATKNTGTFTVKQTTQVQYREKTYKFYKEGPGTTEKYFSEEPAGYPIKLKDDSILSDWSEWNITKPEEKEYRKINEKLQMRKRKISGEFSENLTKEELEEKFGKTLEELESDPTISISSQVLYRYKTRIELE